MTTPEPLTVERDAVVEAAGAYVDACEAHESQAHLDQRWADLVAAVDALRATPSPAEPNGLGAMDDLTPADETLPTEETQL